MNAVHILRHEHKINTLCRVLNVNRSTYYKHFKSEEHPCAHTIENQRISSAILHIHGDYDMRLGAYKIQTVLARDYGINISAGRVYRLMDKLQLPKIATKKTPKSTAKTGNGNEDCRNILEQKFNPDKPNLVWASDITYIKCCGKWYYLCIIMDLFSRKIIAWNLSARANVDLVIETFRLAYEKRISPQGLLFHSDRGSQYTAFAFRRLLSELKVVQSFSKKGYPFDNACCESFFKTLKREETGRRIYHSLDELKRAIFEYIDGFYNSRRPHNSLDMKTPNEVEKNYWKNMGD